MEWIVACVVGAGLFAWLLRTPTAAPNREPTPPAEDPRFFHWDTRRGESFFLSWTIDLEKMRLTYECETVGSGGFRSYAAVRRKADGTWFRLDDVGFELEKLRRTLAAIEREIASMSLDDKSRSYRETERECTIEEIEELRKRVNDWYEITDEWVGALETAYQCYISARSR